MKSKILLRVDFSNSIKPFGKKKNLIAVGLDGVIDFTA